LPFAGVPADSRYFNNGIRKYPDESLLPSGVRSAYTLSGTETRHMLQERSLHVVRRMDERFLAELRSLWLAQEQEIKLCYLSYIYPKDWLGYIQTTAFSSLQS